VRRPLHRILPALVHARLSRRHTTCPMCGAVIGQAVAPRARRPVVGAALDAVPPVLLPERGPRYAQAPADLDLLGRAVEEVVAKSSVGAAAHLAAVLEGVYRDFDGRQLWNEALSSPVAHAVLHALVAAARAELHGAPERRS